MKEKKNKPKNDLWPLTEAIDCLSEKVDRLLAAIDVTQCSIVQIYQQLHQQGEIMATTLDNLIEQVAANTDLEQSAIVLIKGLVDSLAAAGNDPAKLEELRASLKASADRLAEALLAGTPGLPA